MKGRGQNTIKESRDGCYGYHVTVYKFALGLFGLQIDIIGLLQRIDYCGPSIGCMQALVLDFLGFFWCRVCHVLGICYTICTLLNKMAGKTSRCESIYSSFEQLKEFKIDVNKGISESIKKTNTLLSVNFFYNTKYFAKRINHDRSGHFVNLNKFDRERCQTMMCTGNS